MPLPTNDDTPIKFPTPDYLPLGNFKRGVITLIDRSNLPRNAMEKAQNTFLIEDGVPDTRPGVDWYGAVMPNAAAIDGYDYFDFAGVIHLVAVAGGNVYRSTNDGTSWTICTGGTTTAGTSVQFNQNGSYLYITTGVDNILRYDGSTTLQVYSSLATPGAPTIAVTGLAGAAYTYYYKCSRVNAVGYSASSVKVTQTVGLPRDSWTGTTDYLKLTMPAYVAGQTRFDVYISEDDIYYYYLGSTTNPALEFKDDGTAIPVPSTLAPTADTTTGPRYAELTNIGVRQFGVRDPSNRYRIGFTGAGNFSGAFSTAYDGGYLDWQPGGKYYPIKVVDNLDGKGNPVATVFCDSADGKGCILQMTLGTYTVGDISITLPSAYQIPGSRGTPAPGSVISVLKDYYFYNSQAVYNLGPRASLLNLVSTDEVSANVRPSVKQISHTGEQYIATEYFDANIYISVPIGDTVNNTTMIYNTELQAWLPEAFTIGFKKFLRYTDTTREQHLLALKPGDNRLSQISKDISGDYGVPFELSILTGLYPTMRGNRYEFQYTEEAEMEFSNPGGTSYVEILGIDRVQGFSSVKIVPISVDSTVSSGTGWDSFAWDSTEWDETTDAPTIFSESSVKRYTTVQRELNAVQWHIFHRNIDSRLTLRSLQSWGTPTDGGHPASWRVNGI